MFFTAGLFSNNRTVLEAHVDLLLTGDKDFTESVIGYSRIKGTVMPPNAAVCQNL